MSLKNFCVSPGIYFKKFDTSTWLDFTEFTSNPSWEDRADQKRFKFSVTFEKPEDELENLVYINNGDDIAITLTKARTEIIGDILSGAVTVIKGQVPFWGETPDKTEVVYELDIYPRNFSYGTVLVDEKNPFLLSEFLNQIINNNTTLGLGGYKNDGSEVPKFILPPELDLLLPSIQQSGESIALLENVLPSIGYDYRVEFISEPDPITVLKRYKYIRVFDKLGLENTSSDWNNGLTRQTIQDGVMTNPFFDGDNTPNEPPIMGTEKDFSFEDDSTTIENYLRILAFIVQETAVLTRFQETQVKNKDTFVIGKATDLFCVAVSIEGTVFNTTSTTEFQLKDDNESIENIPAMVQYDLNRLIDNDLGTPLICRIESGGQEYFREFTLLGTTFELLQGTLQTPSVDGSIVSLQDGDKWELIGAFDILRSNEEEDKIPPDGNGYVTKSITSSFAGDCSFTFSGDDIPNPQETVVAYFYEVSDFAEDHRIIEEIQRYGQYFRLEKIEFKITETEINSILDELLKRRKPLVTINFTSYRKTLLARKTRIKVELENVVPSGDYFVTDMEGEIISPGSIYDDRGLIEQKITLSSYVDNLLILLARIDLRKEVEEALLRKIVIDNYTLDIELFFNYESGIPKIPYMIYSTNYFGANKQLASIDPFNSTPINLSNNAFSDFLPYVSYDSTKVVFLSNESGSLHVWMADITPTGLSNRQQLTTLTGFSGKNFVSISPDNNYVAWTESTGFNINYIRLSDMATTFDNGCQNSNKLSVIWSKDGKYLIISNNPFGTFKTYTVPFNYVGVGSGDEYATNQAAFASPIQNISTVYPGLINDTLQRIQPKFNKAYTKLLYRYWINAVQNRIAEADLVEYLRLNYNISSGAGTVYYSYPFPSPDGSEYCFCASSGGEAPIDYDVWKANMDGTGATNLFTIGSGIGDAVCQVLSWRLIYDATTPTEKIIFHVASPDIGGNGGIYWMNTDGTNPQQWTQDVGGIEVTNSPWVNKDGTKILYTTDYFNSNIETALALCDVTSGFSTVAGTTVQISNFAGGLTSQFHYQMTNDNNYLMFMDNLNNIHIINLLTATLPVTSLTTVTGHYVLNVGSQIIGPTLGINEKYIYWNQRAGAGWDIYRGELIKGVTPGITNIIRLNYEGSQAPGVALGYNDLRIVQSGNTTDDLKFIAPVVSQVPGAQDHGKSISVGFLGYGAVNSESFYTGVNIDNSSPEYGTEEENVFFSSDNGGPNNKIYRVEVSNPGVFIEASPGPNDASPNLRGYFD